MKKQTLVIFALVAVLIGMGVFSFNQNEYIAAKEIELRRKEKQLRKANDSLQAVINRKDEQILKSMRLAAEKDLIAQEAEKKAKRLINEAKNIKRVTTHSDAERDSLLRVVLGK